MSGVTAWVMAALTAAAGVALAAGGLSRLGRPRLRRRLDRYTAPPSLASLRHCGAAPLAALGRRLTRWFGDREEIERRLARAGRSGDLARYQVQRAAWGVGGIAVAAFAASCALAAVDAVSPVLVVVAAAALAPGGVVVCDRRLLAGSERRVAALRQELPAAADLLAMSLGAGESLRGGLERVAAATRGPCGEELRRVVADASAAVPLRDALAAWARRLDLPELRRLADTVAAAATLGSPAAGPLGALASDMREQTRRDLVENAGRRQVGMLVPVVGLILPAALMFAFYPAVVALRELAG